MKYNCSYHVVTCEILKFIISMYHINAKHGCILTELCALCDDCICQNFCKIIRKYHLMSNI